jgi:hypothetical protein
VPYAEARSAVVSARSTFEQIQAELRSVEGRKLPLS